MTIQDILNFKIRSLTVLSLGTRFIPGGVVTFVGNSLQDNLSFGVEIARLCGGWWNSKHSGPKLGSHNACHNCSTFRVGIYIIKLLFFRVPLYFHTKKSNIVALSLPGYCFEVQG